MNICDPKKEQFQTVICISNWAVKEGQAKGPGTFITEATTNFTVPIKRGSNTQSRTDLLADTLGKLKQKNLINPYT